MLLGILSDVLEELERAKGLHPNYPEDLIHRVAIASEEAGETMQAALNHVYDGGEISRVREEAIQAAAMYLRLLESLPID